MHRLLMENSFVAKCGNCSVRVPQPVFARIDSAIINLIMTTETFSAFTLNNILCKH